MWRILGKDVLTGTDTFSELRPGQQHSINGTPDFMDHCFDGTDSLCIPRSGLLVRADCGMDGAEFMTRLLDDGVPFLVKRNVSVPIITPFSKNLHMLPSPQTEGSSGDSCF